jgi:hypothetical protein
MKRSSLALAVAGLLMIPTGATAALCTIDAVPAATLLLPYFEVDLNDPNGLTTLFSINNASNTAEIAHVVVWSDLSVPVLDFDVPLTGYDVQTMNLRDVLINGLLAGTVSSSRPGRPGGPIQLPQSYIDHLQNALTGHPSDLLGGLCAGRNLGDNVARGYITADVVNDFTLRFVGDPGYLTDDIAFDNVLWGDYFYVNSGQNFADGDTLVHIEASLTDPATTTPGRYTFYGRFANWNATDHREPLPTTFAGRFVTAGDFTGGTSFAVWRDSKTNQQPFTCSAVTGRPIWFPLGQEGIDIFDEAEQVNTPQTFPFSPQPPQQGILPFPAEAQRTKIGSADLPVPFDFGWLYLDLNTTLSGNPNPPFDPAAAQGWVTVIMDASGRFSVGFSAIQLDSACAPNHFVP